ncbi:hypothetical protein Pf1_01072 [Flavobacterium columnare]|nr:hypothetical protein Pf1_01072 [Flavobacterium columnare]
MLYFVVKFEKEELIKRGCLKSYKTHHLDPIRVRYTVNYG